MGWTVKRSLRNYFLTGIFVLLPLAVTVYVLYLIFDFVDNLAGSVFLWLTGYKIPGVGIAVTVVVILAAGVLATNFIGHKLVVLWETIFLRIPLANWIYRIVKQIVDTLSQRDRKVFREVVMVEYPRRGMWVVGFVIGPAEPHIFGPGAESMSKVFVPTVPNPTSGFLLIIPNQDLVRLNIPVEQGIKIVISAGIVTMNQNGNQGLAGKQVPILPPR